MEVPEIEQEDPYFLQCKYFTDCIDNDLPIENATLEDGRNALELALAASRSAREQRQITL
jgi:predicted dehydrogenase